jgi:hypothetical protein
MRPSRPVPCTCAVPRLFSAISLAAEGIATSPFKPADEGAGAEKTRRMLPLRRRWGGGNADGRRAGRCLGIDHRDHFAGDTVAPSGLTRRA